MRRRIDRLIRLGAGYSLLLFVMPSSAQKTTYVPIVQLRPPIPAVSLRRVADYLQGPQQKTVAQPGALVPAFEQLLHLNSAPRSTPVHILHFGDSHTASDGLTVTIRQLLKERFGDGGSGFSLAGHPFRDYRRFDVRGGSTMGWHAGGLLSPGADGYYGLGGVSISTHDAGQSVFINTDCDYLEIHYLQQPGGGDLALFDGDKLLERFSTAGDWAPGDVQFRSKPGFHRFVLKTVTSRPVRLFGWVSDKETGITYEALGINGVEASVMLRWDEKMFSTYLQRRNPGLVVLAYGTNEAVDRAWNPEKYQAMFSALLQRIRRAIPTASILAIGPPDCWSKYRGTWRPLAGLDGIIEAQQTACRENGCAFWDTRQRMGGTGSMRDWVHAGLAQGDYIHFTPAGYRRLATALFLEMMRLYGQFIQIRAEISDSVSDGPANQDR